MNSFFQGVTFIGARAQIEKQLRTAGDLSRDELWTASTYVARAVSAQHPKMKDIFLTYPSALNRSLTCL